MNHTINATPPERLQQYKHMTVLPDFADFNFSLNHDKANLTDFHTGLNQ